MCSPQRQVENDWSATYIDRVLQHTGGNKQAATLVLGVDRKTLDRMIKRHGI